MPNNQIHAICVQPYGYIDGPDDRSSGAMGSRARLDKGLELAKQLWRTGDVLFLFPQGFGKENPTQAQKRSVSLGESMARYVESMLPTEHPRVRVHFEPRSWGTLNDIQAVCEILWRDEISSHIQIHFVTDPEHLKRVRMIWKHLNRFGWKATFHAAVMHRMSWKERRIREPLARLQYRYKLLRSA